MKRRVTIILNDCNHCPHNDYDFHTLVHRCKLWEDINGEYRIIDNYDDDGFPKWCQLEMVLKCGD